MFFCGGCSKPKEKLIEYTDEDYRLGRALPNPIKASDGAEAGEDNLAQTAAALERVRSAIAESSKLAPLAGIKALTGLLKGLDKESPPWALVQRALGDKFSARAFGEIPVTWAADFQTTPPDGVPDGAPDGVPESARKVAPAGGPIGEAESKGDEEGASEDGAGSKFDQEAEVKRKAALRERIAEEKAGTLSQEEPAGPVALLSAGGLRLDEFGLSGALSPHRSLEHALCYLGCGAAYALGPSGGLNLDSFSPAGGHAGGQARGACQPLGFALAPKFALAASAQEYAPPEARATAAATAATQNGKGEGFKVLNTCTPKLGGGSAHMRNPYHPLHIAVLAAFQRFNSSLNPRKLLQTFGDV